ncbi:RluA family pseudouridine synthase [Commensalibacter papalotli (ex Servin-Garciduenas et al. 2014)]|uniref:Pseudouridine synthase n=1 Tax=Commensalibacter papalotli (ex Servin-Garciduenas et al. 2014) TaxID=1208583 RepID=W7E2J0_9PROT|nr:RluA family pseudouridine synthase [Commensalibacter papalotli (ex Servin-Garciduenas et al. 2014)]EUK19344.1 RluA family pseudouridine synthase [Commensalibacter papalotli (ex Servin-Garciduenas et al. 2014)]
MSDTNNKTESSFVALVARENNNIRLDRFLAQTYHDYSRSRLKSLIEQGLCQRNHLIVRDPSTSVKENDHIELHIPQAKPYALEAQKIDLDILYEDHDLIVVNKSAGLVVHPAPGNEDGTLVNALLAHCGDTLTGIGGEKRPGIVHRLDKDTSGIIVVAKTEQALTKLSEDFANRNIDRLYLALCWGILSPTKGSIEGNIGRDPYDRKRMAVVKRGGKFARTHYKTLQLINPAISLIQCKLDTGRTHQIRVHLSKEGHPLIGDPVYLKRVPTISKQLSDEQRNITLDFPRQALHATFLGFSHPITGKYLQFETELPKDMQDLIKNIIVNI